MLGAMFPSVVAMRRNASYSPACIAAARNARPTSLRAGAGDSCGRPELSPIGVRFALLVRVP